MKILVTGANGFIGKNLISQLNNIRTKRVHPGTLNPDIQIFEYTRESDSSILDEYCKHADFVFHLAGVNRPKDDAEFMKGNYGITFELLEKLKKHKNFCPVMLASSIQAELENPYGISKKAGEDLVLKYGSETGARTLIYRFPNVFGKWSKPFYNSVVATFCYQVARDLPIVVNNPETEITLVYIDDIVEELIRALSGKENCDGKFCSVPVSYNINLGCLASLLCSFNKGRLNLNIPEVSDPLTRKMYATYLSFLPEDEFSYPLKMNTDERGSFTEIVRTAESGQFSVNISRPGMIKGEHWHHTKNEKFIVVSGEGVIRFRKIDDEKVIEYYVSGEQLKVVEIPPGYTHNIENLGKSDLITIMWASESFDPDTPDTYYLKVEE